MASKKKMVHNVFHGSISKAISKLKSKNVEEAKNEIKKIIDEENEMTLALGKVELYLRRLKERLTAAKKSSNDKDMIDYLYKSEVILNEAIHHIKEVYEEELKEK